MSRRWREGLILVAVSILGLSSGYLVYQKAEQGRPVPEGALWPHPPAVKPFQLEASDGGYVDLDRLQGRWTFVFFGFTYCTVTINWMRYFRANIRISNCFHIMC